MSEVETEVLVHEVQRRLECLNKPDKHLVLIGGRPRDVVHCKRPRWRADPRVPGLGMPATCGR